MPLTSDANKQTSSVAEVHPARYSADVDYGQPHKFIGGSC